MSSCLIHLAHYFLSPPPFFFFLNVQKKTRDTQPAMAFLTSFWVYIFLRGLYGLITASSSQLRRQTSTLPSLLFPSLWPPSVLLVFCWLWRVLFLPFPLKLGDTFCVTRRNVSTSAKTLFICPTTVQYSSSYALVDSLPLSCFILGRGSGCLQSYRPRGRPERKSIRASRYESGRRKKKKKKKVQSVFHAETDIHTHTHLTSAWNVVEASAAQRMENGVRGRQGKGGRRGRRRRRREEGVDTKEKEISGRNMNGRGGGRGEAQSDGHGRL